MSVPRMRTLPKLMALLREMDPDTAVTLTALRRMAKRGEIQGLAVASQMLFNADEVLDYLAYPENRTSQQEMPQIGTIRRVQE